MDTKDILAAYLKKRRAQENLSLRKFAEQLGISHSTLDNLEKAAAEPELPTIEAVAKGLGLKISELFEELERRINPFIILETNEKHYQKLREYQQFLIQQEEREKKSSA